MIQYVGCEPATKIRNDKLESWPTHDIGFKLNREVKEGDVINDSQSGIHLTIRYSHKYQHLIATRRDGTDYFLYTSEAFFREYNKRERVIIFLEGLFIGSTLAIMAYEILILS